ncbi:MAG: undecaprenyl-diphosphate phosphatase [Candidatus Roizmanbacteria bacterium]|nr:undecaprenyl-diphosphate phosphatase [Candidatus Roizmanbacteria bacterium]
MMQAILLGIVEGLTEFLPVSSTAHLIIVAHIVHITQSEYWKFFEVFIQGGAICAVGVSFFKSLIDKKLLMKLAASFFPTAVVGFVLYKVIKTIFFESTGLIAFMLIAVGFIFLLVEWAIRTKRIRLTKDIISLTWRDAVIIGLAQSIAVVPGVSRAGAVIVAALLLGYRRKSAALYSFLLAVPTIIAAAGYDLLKTDTSIIFSNSGTSVIGLVVAFITAYIVVKWFIGYIQQNTLELFAWYRIALGMGVYAMRVFGLWY